MAGEWEQLFSYVTYCIDLIHIAINFHQDIPYIYQLWFAQEHQRLSSYGLQKNIKAT